MASPSTPPLYTIGHSTRSADELIALLQEHDVEHLVDVRTMPRSRRNPQFNVDVFPETLREADIEHTHLKDLGGLRKTSEDSPNKAWRNESFRGYADYMQTPAFEEALGHLMALMGNETVAVMCAEAVPWRCHRSLIADALVARGYDVQHIMGPGKTRQHELRDWAEVEGTRITYPPDS